MTSIDNQIASLLASTTGGVKVLVPYGLITYVTATHPVPVEVHAEVFTEVQDSDGIAIARQMPPPVDGPDTSKQDAYNAAIAAGYSVQPEGFTLALEDGDRAQFAQLLALVREALDLGLITGTTPQSIKDKSGVVHQVTTDRLRGILVAYGFHYKGLWDALNS